MKRLLSLLLSVLLMCGMVFPVQAVDPSREYFFELSVDGSDTRQAQTGDILTVVFTLYRTDSADQADMYAMQNEIRYDSNFFRLVEGSTLLSRGITTTDIGMRDEFREFYMNFVSLTGGESWPVEKMIGSIQLEVIGTSGVSKITNQDYLVSTADGRDSFKATCQDVTVILSTDCTVNFESNGGSAVESQTVVYGETVVRPQDPVREGYTLEGWYADIDLKTPWDFDNDTVRGNMTLYAKWQKAGADTGRTGGSGIGWVILLVIAAMLGIFWLILLLIMRKTVRFVTDCDVEIPEQKIWRGGFVDRPAEPKRAGRIFAGWYTDEQRMRRWDFEEDKVQENMTLYAKWL